ncbi:DNA polymerase IV [Priestia megaterium]|nr:DNA polymerase IV [Priestia megaterium]
MKAMYPKNGKVILHIDANAFYASAETARNPSLANRPVAIAGNPKERRGIVVTCNYTARKQGVYAPMPLWEAKKKCPELHVLKPDFPLYREVSTNMFNYLLTISPLLEPASIDEGYLDITNCFEQGSPLEIANKIQQTILAELKIPVSIGIAPNKFLAKTASDMKKPLGITVLRKRDIETCLWPKPVVDMHGIGQKIAEKLYDVNIKTIGELAKAGDVLLKNILGVKGIIMKERANGVDDRAVNPNRTSEFKSIGNSTTLSTNATDERDAALILEKLAVSVSERMKQKKVVTTTIQLTIRYSNFKTITRSKTISNAVNEKKDLFHHATNLFQKHWNGDPIRLLGITALQVTPSTKVMKQLDLFTYEQEAAKEPLFKTLEHLKKKYGESIIQQGVNSKEKQ